MIVICDCGQKNRVKAGLVTGAVSAKDVRCGKCKGTLRELMGEQADRNAIIVLAIVEYFANFASDELDYEPKIRDIFESNGIDLAATVGDAEVEDDVEEVDVEEDDESDEADDDDDEEDAPPPPKRSTMRKIVNPRRKKTAKKRTH